MAEAIATTGEDEVVKEYRALIAKKLIFIASCLVVLVIAIGVSLGIGSTHVGFSRVYELLFDHVSGVHFEPGTDDSIDDAVIWDYRLPRTLFAIIAGAVLAVAGVAMQGVMNNPLADPYTTGISSGACFGVSIAVVLGITLVSNSYGNLALVVNSFFFSMIPIAMIVAVAPRTRSSPATLILAGTAIAYIFNALNTLLMVSTDAETLAEVYRWQVGSIEDIIWDDIPLVFVISLVGIIIISLLSRQLNILSLGESSAKSLGIDVDNLRIILLLVMAFMVAAVVSYAGIIGFLGLVSPHIVRMLIDSDNRYVIPASALFSATLLLVCDIICRLISPNGEVAVGVVVSFIGAPIFLYLLVRRDSNIW